MPASKVQALPFFHAFTGCDVTSFFAGRGKKSAWDTWQAFPDVTEAFLSLSLVQCKLTDGSFALTERFVVLWYDRTSELSSVNEARQHMFSRKSKSLDGIPPTQAALKQHILRSYCQGGHVWGQSLEKDPKLLSPSLFGWQWDEGSSRWLPKWTTLQQAHEMCYELIQCNCKKSCRGLCKCNKGQISCTALCNCEGNCFQE